MVGSAGNWDGGVVSPRLVGFPGRRLRCMAICWLSCSGARSFLINGVIMPLSGCMVHGRTETDLTVPIRLSAHPFVRVADYSTDKVTEQCLSLFGNLSVTELFFERPLLALDSKDACRVSAKPSPTLPRSVVQCESKPSERAGDCIRKLQAVRSCL